MSYTMNEDYSCVWPTGTTPLEDHQGFAIHWWDLPENNPQFWSIVTLLVNRAAQESASVHFVAESGLVACLTSPTEVAWAEGDGGNGWGNRHLISIECNPRCTAEDRETVAELIADQHIQNGIPINLFPHKQFTSTECPGVWEQWIPWLTKRANEIVAEKTGAATPAPVQPASSATPAPNITVPADDKIHWVVESGDTLGKIALYYFNDVSYIDTLKRYNGIADANRIEVGQKIYIPGPLYWTIEAPDSIRSVAAYYGLDPAYLASINGLNGPDEEIYIGNNLLIQK